MKSFLTDLFFPKFCFNCGKEGNYLCSDCLALIAILEEQYCPVCGKRALDGKTCSRCRSKTKLDGLCFATSYQNKLVKKLINQFKYKPFIKDLSTTLASLIITHFYLSNKFHFFVSKKTILVPVPLERKKLKMRGFNQSEEIAEEISLRLKILLLKNVLIKIKKTQSQTELSKEKRKENIKDAFLCKNTEQIRGKKIFLIDDVFTTGATMEECAKTLKQAGALQVYGITVARE